MKNDMKKKTKHAKVKWEAVEHGTTPFSKYIAIQTKAGKHVAHMCNSPSMKADARLIAAAPRLRIDLRKARAEIAKYKEEMM